MPSFMSSHAKHSHAGVLDMYRFKSKEFSYPAAIVRLHTKSSQSIQLSSIRFGKQINDQRVKTKFTESVLF